jgi:hypothetical protein
VGDAHAEECPSCAVVCVPPDRPRQPAYMAPECFEAANNIVTNRAVRAAHALRAACQPCRTLSRGEPQLRLRASQPSIRPEPPPGVPFPRSSFLAASPAGHLRAGLRAVRPAVREGALGGAWGRERRRRQSNPVAVARPKMPSRTYATLPSLFALTLSHSPAAARRPGPAHDGSGAPGVLAGPPPAAGQAVARALPPAAT